MKDSVAEKIIEDARYKYSYVEKISIKSISRTKRSFNPRLNTSGPFGLKEDVVSQIRAAISAGARHRIPAVVLARAKNGFDIISGYHRIEAFILEAVEFTDAYVVVTQDESDVRTLAIELNLPTAPISTDERLVLAVDLMERGGLNIVDAARRVSVAPSTISRYRQYLEGKKRATALGISGLKLVHETFTQLNHIKNEEIFGEAVRHRVREICNRSWNLGVLGYNRACPRKSRETGG